MDLDDNASEPDQSANGKKDESPCVIRDGKLYLNPGWGAYIASPVDTSDPYAMHEDPPTEAASSTLELVKVVGPVMEPPIGTCTVCFDDSGFPYPVFLFDLFPLLRQVNAQGTCLVMNPLSDMTGETLPERVRLTAWRAGWGRDDIETFRQALQPALLTSREWVRRVQLWGPDFTYQVDFLLEMGNRFSTIVDLARSFGMGFDGGMLVGCVTWPKERVPNQGRGMASQALVDLWRMCSDLIAWGYTKGIPRADRPAGLDALFAERIAHVVERLESLLKLIDGGTSEAKPYELDIIQTLHEVGHRLTTNPLIGEMRRRHRDHGESTIKKALASMVCLGDLTNSQRARPRGYGLPGWEGSPAGT